MSSDPQKRRRIERELGVPVPGEIVEESQWTNTALKRLPERGPLDWRAIFGREAPRVLDLGCGNGRYLLGSSVWRPDHDHLGIDILPLVIRYATRRANQRGLNNVRFAVIGGRELLANYVAPSSVAEIHCYHPQPYHDPSQAAKRLVTPEFLAIVHQSLRPEGRFILQTDSPEYWQYIQRIVSCYFDFAEHDGRWPDAPKGRTRREIMDLRRNIPVFRGSGRPKPGLSMAAALQLAASLPMPTFITTHDDEPEPDVLWPRKPRRPRG